jgi:hypothetical protein
MLALLCALAFVFPGVRPELDGVPAERLARLARGVNVAHWFWLAKDDTRETEERTIVPADVEQLRTADVTHVRLPVEPAYLWDDSANTLRPDRVERLRKGMSLFTDRGVAVVVEAHPSRTPWAGLKTPGFADEFDAFWKALALALKDTDPGLVLLEIMNEPHDAPDPQMWPSLQARLAKTIRAAAPRHTIVATAADWSAPDDLAKLEPLPDRNVVYTFHFYEPHTFTHQGATWGAKNWVNLKDIPYPGTPETIKACLAGMNEAGQKEARWYAEKRWDRARIAGLVSQAADWAEKHKVPLWCGEFGAYRATTPLESRRRWYADVMSTLRERGIGWCVWDYSGGFGVLEGEPGARRWQTDIADVLGLTPTLK